LEASESTQYYQNIITHFQRNGLRCVTMRRPFFVHIRINRRAGGKPLISNEKKASLYRIQCQLRATRGNIWTQMQSKEGVTTKENTQKMSKRGKVGRLRRFREILACIARLVFHARCVTDIIRLKTHFPVICSKKKWDWIPTVLKH